MTAGSPLACPACAAAMPATYRYCGLCGAPLHPACPACGAAMPPEFRYCGLCGTPLAPRGAVVTASPRTAPAASTSEQRRRVAILFADLSGSTALTHRLEAEAVFEIMRDCLEGLCGIVASSGGYVVKTLGDGLMALFGAPVAHGDDPAHAAAAGLRLQEWMAEYGEGVRARHDTLLRLRVGINYGSVVAVPLTAGGRPAYDALGDAVNVAQRVESAAEPGTVYASEPFYRVTRREFEYEERGAARVKGKPEPLPVYRLMRPRPAAVGRSAGAPLVGRDAELECLRAAVRRLAGGAGGAPAPPESGSVLALVGGMGMGKSRLLDELASELDAAGIRYLRGTGGEGGAETPLALWRRWLLALLPVEAEQSHETAEAAVRAALEGDPERSAWAGWLAALAVAPERLAALDAGARAEVTRGAVRALLGYWQAGSPAALLVDEAGWLDDSSRALLLEAHAGPSLLVAVAGREAEGFPPPAAEAVRLVPLSAAAVGGWLRAALPGVAVPDELCARVAERSGGSPLYLDLMLRAAREAPDPLRALTDVPDSVYGLARAQLDALPAVELAAAQAAAVLGKRFAERWLAGLGVTSAGARGLETRELLLEQRPAPTRELAFRHGALQEVLYEGLLRPQRREAHAAAAAVVARDAAEHPEFAALAAAHWRAAERWEETLRWAARAAEHAAALHTGDAAETLFEECRELAERLDQPADAARALGGLARLAAHRGEFPRALERFRAALDCLEEEVGSGTPAPAEECLLRAALLRGHARVLGQTGAAGAALPRLEEALELLRAGEAAGEPEAAREEARCRVEQAHALRDLGHLEQARGAGERALALAEAGGWNSERAAAGAALGLIYPLLGDWPAAERELRRAAALAEADGDWQGAAASWINLGAGIQLAGRLREAAEAFERAARYAAAIGDTEKCAIAGMNRGLVLLNRGAWTAAEAAFRAALERFLAMQHPLGAAMSLANLAETLRWGGRAAEAESCLAELEQRLAEVDSPMLQVHLLLGQGEHALLRGEANVGGELACWALRLSGEASYPSGENLARLLRGRALARLGRHDAAGADLRAAAAGFDAAGEPLEGVRARAGLAGVLAAAGEHSEAEALAAEVRRVLRDLEAEPWIAALLGPEPVQADLAGAVARS